VTKSFVLLALGLGAWLVAERVIVDAELSLWARAVAGLSLIAGCVLDGRAVRGAHTELARGFGFRFAASCLLVSSFFAYLALDLARVNVVSPLVFAAWLLPLVSGLLSRIAVERAFRASPFDGARLTDQALTGGGLSVLCWLLFVLNQQVFMRDVRRDVSLDPVSAPSGQVRELVEKLQGDIELVLFFAPDSEVRSAVEPYFRALAELSPRLSVRYTELTLERELAQRHRVRGNGFGLFVTGNAERERGETFEIGRKLDDARRVLRTLDAHVGNHLSVLVEPPRYVYLTTGHGERSVAGDIEESSGRRLHDFERLLARFNVRVRRLGLQDGLGREVPENAAAVLVLGPERPFLDEELSVLERYLARGGALWLSVEPHTEHGLGRLLGRLGVTPSTGTLLCMESHFVRAHNAGDRELVHAHRLVPHPITEQALRSQKGRGAVLLRTSALSVMTPVASSLPTSLLDSEPDCFVDADDDLELSAGEAKGRRSLLVAIDEVEGVVGARVVVSGDADLATDQVLRNDVNTYLALGIVRFLLRQGGTAQSIVMDTDLPVLQLPEQERVWFYTSTFGAPLALLLVAMILRGRARARSPKAG
jgi:hypothetical protein